MNLSRLVLKVWCSYFIFFILSINKIKMSRFERISPTIYAFQYFEHEIM